MNKPTMKQLLEKATPGPWSACQDGKCSCKGVSCGEHPIAEVIHGEWGDSFAALRTVDGEELGSVKPTSVEAYTRLIAYGSVPDEQAEANAQLIARCNPQTMALVIEALEAHASLAASHPHLVPAVTFKAILALNGQPHNPASPTP